MLRQQLLSNELWIPNDVILDGEPCVVNADCIESDSSCRNYVCTSSVGTQTISLANAAVQTSQILESVNESPVQLDKSSSFSNRLTRNYITYNNLEDSDANDDEETLCMLRYLRF